MANRFFLSLLLPALLISCGVPIASEFEVSYSTKEASAYERELEEGEALVCTQEGKANLRWKATDYDGFEVYGSLSKYGSYAKISGDKLLGQEHFETASYRYGYFKIYGVDGEKKTQIGETLSAFGEGTLVFDESDDLTAVQEEIDDVHSHLESSWEGQFSTTRYAMMALPGYYPDLSVKLGYYTSAYGLGLVPDDTTIGELYVSTNVLSNNNSTCTFWRNAENLHMTGSTQFAVSQATSLRRCHFDQNLYLAHPSGWSSGGFLADSKIEANIESRTQQQWMSRNDEFRAWRGASHNYVFAGCVGGVPASAWAENTSRTSVEEVVPQIAEMPFLYYDNTYKLFIPAIRKDTTGVSWGEDLGAGKSVPLDDCYLARDEFDDDKTLNTALRQGKHIVFTPGIYHLHRPLRVQKADTVLLGLGYATLQIEDDNSLGAILADDVAGLRFGSLLIDAGKKSQYMVQVGEAKTALRHHDNPSVFSDIFCRIGGKENAHTEATEAMVIYQNDLIGDNFWLWRADHSRGVAWEDYYYEDEEGEEHINYGNPSITGLRVEGDYVTCYGLMVEHFEGYQTLWNGEYGRTVMYQSEVPYNVPNQKKWMSSPEKEGYASYKVGDKVEHHYALGIGVYWVHYTYDFLGCAIEVPQREGIHMEHLVTTTFSGYESGGIRHVINDYGDAVGEGGKFRALVALYPAA